MLMPREIAVAHIPRRGKCKFTLEEDSKLRELVRLYGTGDWNLIAEKMPGRTVRQCRERWRHYLTPELAKVPFSAEEDALLARKFKELGNQWKLISGFFRGRTDIAIKNRWLLLNRHRMRSETNSVPSIDTPAGPPGVPDPPMNSNEDTNNQTLVVSVAVPEKKPDFELKDIEWEEDNDPSLDEDSYYAGTGLSTDYYCLGNPTYY